MPEFQDCFGVSMKVHKYMWVHTTGISHCIGGGGKPLNNCDWGPILISVGWQWGVPEQCIKSNNWLLMYTWPNVFCGLADSWTYTGNNFIAGMLCSLPIHCTWKLSNKSESATRVQSSLTSQTKPTPAEIVFSFLHREGRVWCAILR